MLIEFPSFSSALCWLNLLQDLTKQLDEVTQNSEIVEIRQKEAECELEAARDRVQQQATEILLKASKTSSSSCIVAWNTIMAVYSAQFKVRVCVHTCRARIWFNIWWCLSISTLCNNITYTLLFEMWKQSQQLSADFCSAH